MTDPAVQSRAIEDLPVVELGAPSLGEPEKDAIAAVLDKGWITMGEQVRSFESEFAEMHDTDDAICVSSATAALQILMQAFDIKGGDEVLVPSLSFVATSNVVVHAGATPVFVDIESPRVPHMSMADAERRLSNRCKAVVLVHYGGYSCDMVAWRAFADEHGLILLEDAAHCAGMAGHGTQSDGAAFSFFANKNMTTAEGGMLVIRDRDRFGRAHAIRNHGMTTGTLDRAMGRATGYDVVEFGHNYRMDEMRAAMGRVQLARLRQWNDRRRSIVARYRELFASTLPEVEIPFDSSHPTAAHIQPILLPAGTDRRRVAATLRSVRIQSSVHYAPIHQFDVYRRTFGEQTLLATEDFASRELTIPLHPQLGSDDVNRVVDAVNHALAVSR